MSRLRRRFVEKSEVRLAVQLMEELVDQPVEQHVGWIMDKKAHAPHRERLESLSESVGSVASSGGGTPQSLPTFHHPSHSLLKVGQGWGARLHPASWIPVQVQDANGQK